MSSSYGEMDGFNQPLTYVVDGFNNLTGGQDVSVRMAVPSHPMWHFIDEGEEVELYVTFGDDVAGIPYENTNAQNGDEELHYQVDLAGVRVPLKPLMCFKPKHCTMFKATTVIKSTDSHGLQPGKPVPFELQYQKGERVIYVTEVTEPNMPVYYEPVWAKLNERDDSLLQRINTLEQGEVNMSNEEQVLPANDSCASEKGDERPPLETQFSRPDTPIQLARDDFFLYYTRNACRPFFQSQNPFFKLVRELMVTPLVNFTGLSLYYQLYLVEIFHVKFITKLSHYVCMPLIVLLTATWFAQWRIVGSYRVEDISVFIVNGSLFFILILQLWYLVWGLMYKMYLFGFFMAWPLFFTYMLSNMMFQIIVINSRWIHDNMTVADVQEIWGQNSHHWYDVFTLAHFGVVWYLNPLLWALGFSVGQALSHAFEAKLPPRVSQTAHWLDLTTILKQNGYVATGLILLSQFIFGTLNEFFASPRLLPLLILRICYNLGFEEKQWVKFRLLVEECLKFGDPAIDYIGRGGAIWPQHFKELEPDALQSLIKTIERGLTKEQKEGLQDPHFLRDEDKFSKELKCYVLLRHRLTKYKIQAYAYGPFTPEKCDELVKNANNDLMENDFPDNPGFRMFLKEARSHFAEMEYRFVTECKLNRVFL